MPYEDFFDLKLLLNDIGPFNMGQIELSEVKSLKVQICDFFKPLTLRNNSEGKNNQVKK